MYSIVTAACDVLSNSTKSIKFMVANIPILLQPCYRTLQNLLSTFLRAQHLYMEDLELSSLYGRCRAQYFPYMEGVGLSIFLTCNERFRA